AGVVDTLERQTSMPPIVAVDRSLPLPLSFAQQRLWFLDQLEPGSAQYNMPAALRLVGRIDAGALQQCLQQIVRRHEVLRTTFDTVDGKPVQVIAPDLTLELPLIDLFDLPPEERQTRARALIRDEAVLPFDLAAGPLIRCC